MKLFLICFSCSKKKKSLEEKSLEEKELVKIIQNKQETYSGTDWKRKFIVGKKNLYDSDFSEEIMICAYSIFSTMPFCNYKTFFKKKEQTLSESYAWSMILILLLLICLYNVVCVAPVTSQWAVTVEIQS